MAGRSGFSLTDCSDSVSLIGPFIDHLSTIPVASPTMRLGSVVFVLVMASLVVIGGLFSLWGGEGVDLGPLEGSWTWNSTLGRDFVFYSYATYCPRKILNSWSCSWCQEPSIKDFQPIAFPYVARLQAFGIIGIHKEHRTSKTVFYLKVQVR